jgi:rhamnosyltransferase
MTSCSIIIRAYNEEKHIGKLLTGIMQQTVKDAEIILVDSGSLDATTAIAARYPVKIVHIAPEEFTFGRSLNLGISQASGEYIIIASAHVYPVYPDWLQRLLAPFDDSKTALTYGKQRGHSASKFSEHQIFARWFPDGPNLRQANPFCNNANAAVRRRLWEEHPYDESLPGLEDLEWAQWAMGQGYGITYVPEAETIHVHEETPRGIYNRYRREAMAFKRIFPNESFHLGHFLRLFLSNTASDAWHAARQRLFWTNAGSILWFRLMQFWGTYQGFRHAGPLTWQLRQTFYYPGDLLSTPGYPPRQVEPIQYKDAAE